MQTTFLTRIGVLLACVLGLGNRPAAEELTKVRMSFDEDMVVTRLAESLGYFRQEGIEIVPVDIMQVTQEDYLIQQPLIEGKVDAVEHWFNHTVFGARHGLPIQAVMMLNDAPAMRIMVDHRVQDAVRSAADFKGRTIAEGAGYATKAVITGYLAHKAGLPRGSYRAINHPPENRLQLVLGDLRAGKLDIMTFQEPVTSGLLQTGMVHTLYDLTTREGTVQALGAPFPAQSILMAPQFIRDHPDTVQRLVNAYVRAMRFLNSHTADEIIAQLPESYFAGSDRAERVRLLKLSLSSYAKGNFAFASEAVRLVVDAMLWAKFDASAAGAWRAGGDAAKVKDAALYTNEFVDRAMQAIPAALTSAAVTGGEPANAGVSIWTQNVTGFRKVSGAAGGYTKNWDLSDLPSYVPKQRLAGTIRIWGNNYIRDGELGEYWREEFTKFHPDVKIEYNLPTTGIAIPALSCGVADVVMSRKAIIMDLLTFEQVFHYPVTEIEAVTGSYDVYGWSPAFIIVVHKDNPLERISIKQLDGVFGAERTGGYVGSVWHTEYPYARGPEENIRTWGQLGLTGEWADKRIRPGGQTLRGNQTTQFSDIVTRGSDQFAEGYQAFANYITPDGKINSWSLQAQRAIAKDRYAMFYVSPMTLNADMKELAVQAYEGGPYVKRSLETVRDRSYPLYGRYYFYVNRKPGAPVDPKADEWLRFILSREGQECVQREGRYLPLTGDIVRAQLRKLD
ncbi:MAG: ABC transporter substrate-binding protein [Opitutaceae bacterium]|nr:ABC transporter substrate-binding protein [Opitutaceae bacterium]